MDDGRGDLARVTEARTGAIDLFRKIGLEVQVKESTGQAQNVRYEDKVANVDVKSTDLSRKYTPAVHFAWGLNSDATHSNIWVTHGLSGPWTQLLVSMVFPLLDISDALTTNLLGYVGLSATEIHKGTHSDGSCLCGGRVFPARTQTSESTHMAANSLAAKSLSRCGLRSLLSLPSQ